MQYIQKYVLGLRVGEKNYEKNGIVYDVTNYGYVIM